MRGSRSVVLAVVAVPFLLMQFNLASCFPGLGGPATSSGGLTFNLPPTVILSSDVVRGIAPLTVRFSSGGSTDDGLIIGRLWDFGDGQTSQEIAPTHTFAATGDYLVRLRLTDDQGVSSSRTTIISVTEAPQARIRVNATVAESAPATFSFDASESFDPDGEIEDYRWDFGDGTRELLPVVVHTYAVAGTYRARLTVTDNNGITGTAVQVIEVGIKRPTIEFRAPPLDVSHVVCSNDSPLWVHAVFDVEPNVSRTIRAGLDGDNDPCDAQAAIFDVASGAALGTLTGHDDRVRVAAYSDNGAVIVTASDDRTLRLYDASSGDSITTLGGLTGVPTSVAFSPDSALIVSGQDDGTVVLRSRLTGAILRNLVGHTAAVNAVAFSADGTRIVTGSDDLRAIVWNAFNGSVVRELSGHVFAITAVAFSPVDSSLVLTGSVDQSARLWDVSSGATLARFEPVLSGGALVSGHANAVTSVAFSPDGAQVLTGSDDRTAKLWSVDGSEVLTLSGHSNRVTSVDFSPDGTRIATGSADGTARLWDASTGETVDVLRPCLTSISSVDFSPDGQSLLTGVAARNDIQLDAAVPNGNDLNIGVPTPLDLIGVPTGQYFLWAEIDTDRTSPTRAYSHVTVSVIPPFTASVDNFTPRIPLVNDRASVIVAPTTDRQIFDLGPLSEGDRLFLSLLSTPGLAQTYDDAQYSVMILDSDQKLFAWYQQRFVLFTAEAKIIVGHNSSNYYVVIDGGDSVDIRIQRGVGVTKRKQRVYLDYVGGPFISVADEPTRDIPSFDAIRLNPAWGAAETAIIKTEVLQRVRDMYDGYDIEFTTSDEGPAPDQPFIRVYFGGFSFFFLGIADYIDPRNETLTGGALVATQTIADDLDFLGLTPTAEEMGIAIGNVAAHEVGHVLGLRHTEGSTNDVMDTDATNAMLTTTQLQFASSNIRAIEIPNGEIGMQDAPLLFEELLGTIP